MAKGGASAETVNLLREENRPVLALVNKVVKDRVKAQRHVFLEQPLGSKSLEEPEMSDVKQMVEEEKLIFLRVDGCMVGYMDAESKKPHNKPSYYLTTMVAAENIFEGIRCDGSHEHEPLEGANRYGPRTAQAAEWPMKLNRMVLEAVIQQSEIEKNAVANLAEAFPAEVRQQGEQGGRERKRRRGRMAILAHEFETPPVYVRPEDVERPEVVMEPKDDDENPARLPHDDHDYRAEAAASLDAVLNKTEGESGDEPAPMMEELPASAIPGGAADSPGYSPTTEPGDPDSVPMLLPPQQLQAIPEVIEEDQPMPTPVRVGRPPLPNQNRILPRTQQQQHLDSNPLSTHNPINLHLYNSNLLHFHSLAVQARLPYHYLQTSYLYNIHPIFTTNLTQP